MTSAMPPMYVVIPIDALRSSTRRGVAWLRSGEGNEEVNAERVFTELKESVKRNVLARFDHWISGEIHDRYFHGWPNDPDCKELFVFKYKKANVDQRLYGFLVNPLAAVPNFQVCVLVTHASKTKWDTDPQKKTLVNKIRVNSAVINAVCAAYQNSIQKRDSSHGIHKTLERRKRR